VAVHARNAADYRAAVARLKARPAPCWKRCGRTATTIDHVPALALHHHTGRGCCDLRPACSRCNYADGARIAARLKARKRTARRAGLASRTW
jgi:5-methylcytosine-specific restriction endonuclease McrA